MHGDYPDYIIRLIRKSKTYWPETIHARPVIDGGIFAIPSRRRGIGGRALANESVSSRIAKIDLYSDKELLRRADQRFSVWKAFSKCSWRFLRFYVVKGGFRDGKAGFTYAVLNACYKFATIAKNLGASVFRGLRGRLRCAGRFWNICGLLLHLTEIRPVCRDNRYTENCLWQHLK